jgi:hypothetical protein
MGVTGRGVAVGWGVLVASTLVRVGLGATVKFAWAVGVTSRPQPLNIDAAIIHQINLDTIRPLSEMRADYTTIKLDIKNLT